MWTGGDARAHLFYIHAISEIQSKPWEKESGRAIVSFKPVFSRLVTAIHRKLAWLKGSDSWAARKHFRALGLMVPLSCGVTRVGQVPLAWRMLGHSTCQIAAGLLVIVQTSHPSGPQIENSITNMSLVLDCKLSPCSNCNLLSFG